MKLKKRPLLALIGLLILTGGVFLFSWPATVLQLKNLDRPRTERLLISPPERFSMAYVHSIYDALVVEEFEIGPRGIALKGVRTEHPGVMEYYGFGDVKAFHPLDRVLAPSFIIKRGIRQQQSLVIRDRTIHLSELAEKGDRIEVRLVAVSAGSFLFWKLFNRPVGSR